MPRTTTSKNTVVRVCAPYSRTAVVRDQALLNDIIAKTFRQEPVERLATLATIAIDNKRKFESITRIIVCIRILSILADVCDNAPRLEDIPKSSPSEAGQKTTKQDTATAVTQAEAPRRSARVAANNATRANALSRTASLPIATQPNRQRKRKRVDQTQTNENPREKVQRVASHASVKDEKRDRPMARHYLKPLTISPNDPI